MSYKINILGNQEFDNLPVSATRGSDVSMSLGFANHFTNNVYVRRIAIPELQNYLIDHELEHLIEEHKTDQDENGICHKGFFDVVRHIINPLNFPSLGPLSEEKKGFLDTSKTGTFNQIASPIANAASQAATGFIGSGFNPIGAAIGGAKGFFGGLNPQKPGEQQGGPGNVFGGMTGMNSLFPTGGVSSASFQPGYGQSAAQSPGSLGPSPSGSGLGLAQMGLGQGGIQMGAGAFNKEQPQGFGQQGNYFPNMGQSNLKF